MQIMLEVAEKHKRQIKNIFWLHYLTLSTIFPTIYRTLMSECYTFCDCCRDTYTATRAELYGYGGYFESFAVLAISYRSNSDTYTSRRYLHRVDENNKRIYSWRANHTKYIWYINVYKNMSVIYPPSADYF